MKVKLAAPPLRASAQCGQVYLVGAGPGDPELLTLRAARLLAEADAVVYDNLIGPDLLRLVRQDAALHYAGKKRTQHALSQEAIGELLVKLARQGLRVVRLKGGDPFIFGRGGEEVEALCAAGVRFEVVPGITAAAGAGAYGGIPITHRAFAQSVVFTTAYGREGALELDWPALARRRQTVVFYMGVTRLDALCETLRAHGLPDDTPAAVVRRATLPDQRVLSSDLLHLPGRAREADLSPPALIVVGDVVSLQARLAWFSGSGA